MSTEGLGEQPVDWERLRQRILQMHDEIPEGLYASQELIRERRIAVYRDNVESGMPVEEAEAIYAEQIAELAQDEADLRAHIERDGG